MVNDVDADDLFVCFPQELHVTDDTVLEEHTEDPTLVQICLLGDGGKPWCSIQFFTDWCKGVCFTFSVCGCFYYSNAWNSQ